MLAGAVLVLLAASAPATPQAPALRAPARGAMLIHVWATWCEPCTAELDDLAAFMRGPSFAGLAERGLRLVTVSEDVRAVDLARYLERHTPPFPVLLDTLGDTSARFALRGLPGTVVIDARGEVVARMLGPQDWRSEAFVARLEGFLGE